MNGLVIFTGLSNGRFMTHGSHGESPSNTYQPSRRLVNCLVLMTSLVESLVLSLSYYAIHEISRLFIFTRHNRVYSVVTSIANSLELGRREGRGEGFQGRRRRAGRDGGTNPSSPCDVKLNVGAPRCNSMAPGHQGQPQSHLF